MIIMLAVLFCVTVVFIAIVAERAARAQRRFRAVCLNLFGIGCLGVGLLLIYAWCQGGAAVNRQLAMAESASNPGTLVRLLVDSATAASQSLLEDTVATTAEAAEPEAAATSSSRGELKELGVEAEESAAAVEQPSESAESADPVGPAKAQIDFAARPAWVESEPWDEGKVHKVSVTAGPYQQLRQAHKALDEELKKATDEYINDLLGSPTAAHWVAYDVPRIRQTLVSSKNRYDEKVVSPTVGVMHQSHALLEFGPDFQRDVEQSWRQIVARARLVKLALGAAAVLGTLVLLFSYFRADTATRGFYTGRLKFATLVAILGLIAAGVLLAHSIPWLWP